MINTAAPRLALQQLCFTQEACIHITDNQDLTTLDNFKILTNKEVKNLCHVICKQKGMAPNANGDSVLNSGISIFLKAINNLKQMCS